MAESPLTLTVVSHTHWDREWYRTFQDFRLRLVRLIDDVLTILDTDPTYHSFLLDGQTIILEDYLEMRPEREADLRRLIAEGRLLIGPWHILPDEFLVGPESTVRNLMLGARVCADFGARMPVGYTPDPFGHISQLPQILAGAGIRVAVFRRGLSEEPLELWWDAPDGTRVLALYLREGYDNFQWVPTDPDAFLALVERQIERMAPHTRSGHLLLLNGTDHMPPQPELPALIREANARLAGHAVLRHGTLPQFADAVQQAIASHNDLPVVYGELCSPRRHHRLPGVLSARMWIKQRNHACETLLTRYAEPLSALSRALTGKDRRGEVWRAWRTLIENHPHDSICGCSIDQVHEEMRTRFDWAEQIASGVIDECLQTLGAQIDAASLPTPQPEQDTPDFAVTAVPGDLAIIVFNPTPGARGETVAVEVPWQPPDRRPVVLDANGDALLCTWEDAADPLLETRTLDAAGFEALLRAIEVGAYRSRLIRDVRVWLDGDEARAEIVLTESHPRDANGLFRLARDLRARIAERPIEQCALTTYFAVRRTLTFHAPDVPGVGYRAFHLGHAPSEPTPTPAPTGTQDNWVENEFLRLEVDPHTGTLTVIDKATGQRFAGLNRLLDGGDRGDEYNYCPPERDSLVTLPALPPRIERGDDYLRVRLMYRLPVGLTDDRAARSVDTVDLPVEVTARLPRGTSRVDIHTELENRARDHRLRVVFPTGIATHTAIVDGHFDRLRRGPLPVEDTTGWVEQPQPTNAMRAFVAVEGASGGLMIAARGLPEYELLRENSSGAAIALTLLRCVGWLSRDDFACRVGQAGPELPTPGAQCLGPASFDYSVIPFGSGELDAAATQAYAFEAPLRAALCVPGAGTLPPQGEWVTLEPAALVLSAIKPADDGDGLIVRFYNSSEQPQTARVTFGFPVATMQPVNLLEEPEGAALDVSEDGRVTLDVPPKRIVTWRVLPPR